jgi:hypothetical protein
MNRINKSALALGIVALTWASAALAQKPETAQRAGGDGHRVKGQGATYSVEFDDDPLAALEPGTQVARLRVRGRVPKVGLLRPRTSFVPEIKKSAESF